MGDKGKGKGGKPALSLEEELAQSKPRILEHMNSDHAESVKAYVHHFGKLTSCTKAELTDVTPDGFKVSATLQEEPTGPVTTKELFVNFPEKLTSARDCRKQAVKLHEEAYAALGWEDYSKKGHHHLPWPIDTKQNQMLTGTLAVAASAALLFYMRRRSRAA